MAAADGRGIAGSWQGYVTEVADFADAVWHGAKERLKELFEEDVDMRVWVPIYRLPVLRNSGPPDLQRQAFGRGSTQYNS